MGVVALLLVCSVSTLLAVFIDRDNSGWWTMASITFHFFLFTGGFLTARRYTRMKREDFDLSRVKL